MGNQVQLAKSLKIEHNVLLRVLDKSGKVVAQHEGHNAATNSLIVGIGQYLIGAGTLNQAPEMLSNYIPKYISLGTMGLLTQECDTDGLPTGIGVTSGTEEQRFVDYMNQCPGFGADGYDNNENNGRAYYGLGPSFATRSDTTKTVKCELVSDTFPRSSVSYRDILPETESELPKTVDVVFSAMISTGALAQFREPGKDYIFITEAALWSTPTYISSGNNGMLAGYRITPSNISNCDMTDAANRQVLKENILRVGINQVVQVIWKIQIGALEQLVDLSTNYMDTETLV